MNRQTLVLSLSLSDKAVSSPFVPSCLVPTTAPRRSGEARPCQARHASHRIASPRITWEFGTYNSFKLRGTSRSALFRPQAQAQTKTKQRGRERARARSSGANVHACTHAYVYARQRGGIKNAEGCTASLCHSSMRAVDELGYSKERERGRNNGVAGR